MPGLRISRWTRFGHDRLYVNGEEGTPLAWVELATGEREILDQARTPEIEDALLSWGVTQAGEGVGIDSAKPPDGVVNRPAAMPAETPGREIHDDMAQNRPGAMLWARAEQERRKAPLRSFMSRLLGRQTEETSWRLGARGEQLVAKRLRRLDRSWRSLHSLPYGPGGADIDHLVIGPGGVFTINTKYHPRARVWAGGRTLYVNGTRREYVPNALREATFASRVLSRAVGRAVSVRGVVAIVSDPWGLTIKAQPDGARAFVVASNRLAPWLASWPRAFGSAEVEHLYEVARHRPRWTYW